MHNFWVKRISDAKSMLSKDQLFLNFSRIEAQYPYELHFYKKRKIKVFACLNIHERLRNALSIAFVIVLERIVVKKELVK